MQQITLRIPKYFTLKELIQSNIACKRGYANIPTFKQLRTLCELAVNVLDPIREMYGSPILVNSCYRCERLNHDVGGVKGSYHLCKDDHAAADITTGNALQNKQLFLKLCQSPIPFNELQLGKNALYIHVSYCEWHRVKEITSKA